MRFTRQIYTSLLGIAMVVVIGTLGFWIFEEIHLYDALWLTMISVLTVGYGDIVPVTHGGRMFAMILIPVGIAIATYALGAVAAAVLDGRMSGNVRRRRMEKQIGKLQGHIIICGLGRVGYQVLKQLHKEKKKVVIVDTMASSKLGGFGDQMYVEGNATEDEVLYKAGIEQAQGLIATLPQDAENVFVTLTAKGMNPNIHVVARAERPESEEKLRRAGADKVINPSSIGGRRMAMSILKPFSVDYVDLVLHDRNEDFGVEELTVGETSGLAGKTLLESRIRELYGVTVVALKHSDGAMIHNPKPEEQIRHGDLLIVFGSYQQLHSFEQACKA